MAQLEFESQLKGVSYAIEKIGDWARGNGSGVYTGPMEIKEVRTALENFKREITKTGQNPEKEPIGIAGELPQIYYVLDQLEAFMADKNADIISKKAAEVFGDWLRYTMDHMRDMAIELDEEYSEE